MSESAPVTIETGKDNPYLEIPEFQEALGHVPDIDVELLLKACDELSKEEATIIIATNKWANKTCNQCYNHEDVDALQGCSKCNLVFYCGKVCQRIDWSKHRNRCCKKDGPPDDGPNALVAVRQNQK